MVDPDALYSGKEVNNIKAGEFRTVGLKQLRMFNGKKVPGGSFSGQLVATRITAN